MRYPVCTETARPSYTTTLGTGQCQYRTRLVSVSPGLLVVRCQRLYINVMVDGRPPSVIAAASDLG